MQLKFSLYRVESGADVGSMIRTFTETILEVRAVAVPPFVQVVSVLHSPHK
jgi:hypothetical protein